MVPTDGRPYRLLDLDEYADAIEDGTLSVDVAVDGLRRWQLFLDRYLHTDRWPVSRWSDFPPGIIRTLCDLAAPFGEPVRPES